MNKKTTTAQAAFEAANPQTGEMQKIKYFEGSPKQYRFNGQNGRFTIDGITDIGTTFTLLPLAYRVFDTELFGRGRIENWAEIFFVDEEGCLSGIMFTNNAVTEIMDLLPRLYYAGYALTDVLLTVTSEKKVTEKEKEKVSWSLAKFDFKPAPVEEVARLAEFATKFPIFRQDTITPGTVYREVSDSYAMSAARQIAAPKADEPEAIERAA